MIEDIVRSANVLIAAKNKYLKYTYCNEKMAECLGADSPSQVIGRCDRCFFDKEHYDIYESGDHKTFDGNILLNEHEVMPNPDKADANSKLQLLVSKNILTNSTGEETGIVISCVDVTGMHMQWKIKPGFNYNENKQCYYFKIGNQTEYFTKLEYNVFKHIILGKTSKQIGKSLFLSHRTIEKYFHRIKTKLQCHSKYKIIETAMILGIAHQFDT